MKHIRKLFQIKAQTAMELAVFGAVLIFLIGLIVRQALNFSYAQNQNLKAMRMAMTVSFEHSQGLRVQPGNPDQSAGSAARNTASVLFVEDRLNATSGKYGALDRIPQIVSGAATHSRNLFMPIESGEYWNLPILDVFINGVHFPFTIANLKTVVPTDLKSLIPNHPADADWNPNCANCFDLDRDGIIDVPAAERANFAWQWQTIGVGSISVQDGENTVVDVDGDLKEERVLDVLDNGSVVVMDFQDGDLDLTRSNFEPPSGFSNDAQMFTFTKNPNQSGPGTYFLVEEGKLFLTNGDTKQYIRTAQRKDSLDIVQREVMLSNNTGRFCQGATPTDNSNPQFGWTTPNENPVEACCATTGCCFTPANIEKTCMVTNPSNLRIFVRSRLIDQHGRKWVTDVSSDPVVIFSR